MGQAEHIERNGTGDEAAIAPVHPGKKLFGRDLDPVEHGRRGGKASKRRPPDPNALARALIRAGARQGAWGYVRQLERQRGAEQLELEEIQRRKAEIEPEVQELEEQRAK